MNDIDPTGLDDRWIKSFRGKKNKLDPSKPYNWSIEKERTRQGFVEDTATVFLTNRECPFTCLMCDLWKNTTNYSVSADEITDQIDWAMARIQSAYHLKIYNSGNFFDLKAIPLSAYRPIADKINRFKTLIIESHPRFIEKKCIQFKDMIEPELQVAIGLETSNPYILSRLNKKMTLEDFQRSVGFLNKYNIPVRAFILLKPPFLDENEGIQWAKRSIDFAFQCGVECCVVIPVRSGNGAIDWLQSKDYFSSPSIESLEEVLQYGINLQAGRVFADIWDIEKFSKCDRCFERRKERLNKMNYDQVSLENIYCNCQIMK
jgi:hypothetical protein